jgi:ribosomal protein S18 acetylase RimI-like enzyme
MTTVFSAPHVLRRATLADVAAVARLTVHANQEAAEEVPALVDAQSQTAPELALRLLDDLEDGSLLAVAERQGRIVGFALASGLMVGDGGHLVELKRLYVSAEHRRRGIGGQLLRMVLRDVGQRAGAVGLRAWAAVGTPSAAFLTAMGASPVRDRWRVGRDGIAVRGQIFGWGEPLPTRLRSRLAAR